jgi:hypothetical protein
VKKRYLSERVRDSFSVGVATAVGIVFNELIERFPYTPAPKAANSVALTFFMAFSTNRN